MQSTTASPSTSPEFAAKLPAGFAPAELEAGLFAVVLPYLAEWGLDHPTLDRVFESLGVSAVRASEAEAALSELLPTALPRPEARLLELTRETVSFLKAHPGALKIRPRRRTYSRAFRRFVLELFSRYGDLELEVFADVVGVPPRTLASWLRRAPRR